MKMEKYKCKGMWGNSMREEYDIKALNPKKNPYVKGTIF